VPAIHRDLRFAQGVAHVRHGRPRDPAAFLARDNSEVDGHDIGLAAGRIERLAGSPHELEKGIGWLRARKVRNAQRIAQ
jgi:hypothetical protein